MKLWKRAAGALKDGNSLLAATGQELEAIVVKATSHDKVSMDYKSAQRLYMCIQASPSNLRPVVRAISTRVAHTCSWQVALKGLILMHGILRCNVPAAEAIGRLPFDLSSFGDEQRSRAGRASLYNDFVRAYFAFLDRRYVFFHDQRLYVEQENEYSSVKMELLIVEKMQSLLDALILIRPETHETSTSLILHAMDCVVLEIDEIYGQICSAIAQVLSKLYPAERKREAEKALKVIEKAKSHGKELTRYFGVCRALGVANARRVTRFVEIPKEEMRVLEKMIGRISETDETVEDEETDETVEDEEEEEEEVMMETKMAMTEKLEAFEEQLNAKQEAPASLPDSLPDLIDLDDPASTMEDKLPDLITF